MWFRRKKHSYDHAADPAKIGARCPNCKRELALFCEQTDLFAVNHPIWAFCPICTRLVSPERFMRTG
jgi:hypothetical protein